MTMRLSLLSTLPWKVAAQPAAWAMLLTIGMGSALAAEKFEKTAIFLEQNIQDKDAEVKLDIIAGTSGLSELRVVAPDGRTVVDFKSPGSTHGLRHFTLETPEPRNDGKLQSDFPAGIYKVSGTTTKGEALQGEATLSHQFPSAAKLSFPAEDAKNISTKGLRIKWGAVRDVEAIAVLVEHEKTGQEVRAVLPGSATGFSVPDGVLMEGETYKLAIGTVAKSGNKTVTEIEFGTGKRK